MFFTKSTVFCVFLGKPRKTAQNPWKCKEKPRFFVFLAPPGTPRFLALLNGPQIPPIYPDVVSHSSPPPNRPYRAVLESSLAIYCLVTHGKNRPFGGLKSWFWRHWKALEPIFWVLTGFRDFFEIGVKRSQNREVPNGNSREPSQL